MNDESLKLSLAKMLPEQLGYDEQFQRFHWLRQSLPHKNPSILWPEIRETEWLHIVWLVEQGVIEDETPVKEDTSSTNWEVYQATLNRVVIASDNNNNSDYWSPIVHASWQQRAIALYKVKKIEI